MCRSKGSTTATSPSHHRSLSAAASGSGSGTGTGTNLSASSSSTSIAAAVKTLPSYPKLLPFSAIAAATSNFSPSLLIPRSSSIYRCTLLNSPAAVAARPLRRTSTDAAARLAAIGRSHHASLARLLGASISADNDNIYVAHEFVDGCSLSDCLRNKNNRAFTPLSSWISRIRVAADVVDGVAYMHEQANVVHNRLKSSSVMVSEGGLRGRILHFGTADLAGDVASDKNGDDEGWRRRFGADRRIDGSRGYLAPEVASGAGLPSKKTDVYALGIIILELVSGVEPVGYRRVDHGSGLERVSIIETAGKALLKEEVGVRMWVDARLNDSYPVDVAMHLTALAIRCVSMDPGSRPEAANVEAAVSRLLLESQAWLERVKPPEGITLSMGPR